MTFLKVLSPNQSKYWGGVSANTSGGGEEGSPAPGNPSQLPPLRGGGRRVLVAFSVTGAERTSPGMASGLSPMTRPHWQSSLPPGQGGNGGEGEPAPGRLGEQGTARTGAR